MTDTPAAAAAATQTPPAQPAETPVAAAEAAVTADETQTQMGAGLDIQGGFSLADLADIDVSEIEEIRFFQLPAAVYDFEVGESDLAEGEIEGNRVFKAEFPLTVKECIAIVAFPGEKVPAKEELIGKQHTKRFTIKPAEQSEEDVIKVIGRIRAFVTDIGGQSAGKLGEVVRNTKGIRFRAQVVKRRDRNDPSIEWTELKFS